jgi:glycosyltransferase involved in cell wall biosynthesis
MQTSARVKRGGAIGFVSTRLSGTDGVSLETAKWAAVFEKAGLTCFYMAGELDRPAARSLLVPKAHFTHPEILKIHKGCFEAKRRSPSITKLIHRVKDELKEKLAAFVKKFDIDILVAENALCIPINIPLGLAITEYIVEHNFPAIAHNHDFFWERKRFLTNAAWDYLNMAFPPQLHSIRHVVINSSAEHQLCLRTGISPILIPNVMDFDTPPPPPDAYSEDIRERLGFDDNELFVLQPTRVVQRKGIEHAIELVRRLGMPAKLVISHAAGDEGASYEKRVREYSKIMGVDTIFISDMIGDTRGTAADGGKVYTIEDVYPHADLVTYPSDFEGFGNAFLETIYFSKPIVVNTYSVYLTDIKPKGFRVIPLDGYVTDEAIRGTRKVLRDPSLAQEMAVHNYELGKKYYSYSVLERKLRNLLGDYIV